MAPRAPAAGLRSRRCALAVLAAAVLAGLCVQRASAALSLRMPVIPWYSVLRGGYIDLVTRQPVTASYSLANAGPVAPGAPGAFQQQNGLFNPAPRPTSRNIFPITLPSLAFWERCFKETDALSALITKCNYQDTYTTCQQLANMGYLPKGVQSFEAKSMTGSFNLPMGCTTASLGVSFDTLFRLTFNSPQVPILAVITKDPIGSMVSYFGTGSTQGRVKHRLAHKVEFCYAPTISEISVSKSAIYSSGMTPGSTSWSFAKSVELAPPYVGGRAAMFNGDTADATWTLAATKFGADVSYQGVVTGSITINNPTPAVITVNSIIDQITGGPASTVVCPVGTPFTVPACSFASCQYTSYYPAAPPPGTYTSAAQVSFQVLGSAGYPSTVQGTTAFNVGVVGSAGLATDLGSIAPGTAVVTDAQAPSSSYAFAGPGSQSFQTQVTCGGASTSGAMSNTAVLTAANGQQVTQSATVQKQCYDLQVSVASKAAPFVGRWGWAVTKSASPSTLALKPDPAAFAGADASAFGRDYGAMTSGDVVYTVTYTRSPPAGFVSGVPAFEASGEVYVQNSAPINARLQSVLISIANSAGGAPYVTEATCPVLTVAAGSRVTCQWRATPTFNPVGQNVRGIARYINTRNGEPRGGTTDFTSAPVTIGGGGEGGDGAKAGGSGGRALLQTWGGAAKATTVGVLPELEAQPALATTLYAADGSAMVVPNSVADGSAVIVSGAGGAPGGPVLAVGDGVAVAVPRELRRGAVNEAGPADAAAALGLTGLQDECVDVADTFLTGDGNVQGRLISGTQPSGRICSTTTFTYTMRYGPYADCAPRKSVNAATFQAVDTQARGSGQADVAISVDGCMTPGALKIAPGRTLATTGAGYSWTVTKRADVEQLAVGQDATGVVTYTVDVKRSGGKGGATLAGDAAVRNPSAYPVPTTSATYTVTTLCDGEARTTSGAATCDADAVPAGGKVGCKFAASLPCAGTGAYTMVLTAANGFVVTGPPTPFAFNSTQLASAASGECADVKDVFLAGEGRAGGAVVSGTRPNGRLCGSKTFTYAVKFGPFTECTSLKAVNVLSLASNGLTKQASASHTLPLYVVGCDVYTPSGGPAADCVKPASWWSKCDGADAKCAQGWKLLPGGKGKGTLFFPKPNERSARTYETMLAGGPLAAAAAAKKAYVSAAQAFVGAQLNFLSGARLPSLELQETFDALGAFLSTNSEGSAMSDDQVAAINIQAGLLAKYNNGTLPADVRAPPVC